MKSISSVTGTPVLFLGDTNSLPAMLITLGLADSADSQEFVNFAAELPAIRHLAADLLRMADQLEQRAVSLGVPLLTSPEMDTDAFEEANQEPDNMMQFTPGKPEPEL